MTRRCNAGMEFFYVFLGALDIALLVVHSVKSIHVA
jgi:hypothetical protein